MVTDPYQVLGISKGASKEEIKKAYRKKAKENHPDLHPDDPRAAEKMNEINEAYDMLSNPEKYGGRWQTGGYGSGTGDSGASAGYGGTGTGYGGAGGNGSYGSYQGQEGSYGYGFDPFEDFFHFGGRRGGPDRPVAEPGDSDQIRRVIEFIGNGNYRYARQLLNTMVSDLRNARWYYLSAVTAYGLGDYVQAMEHISYALQAEPGNTVYGKAMQDMKSSQTAYNSAGAAYSRYGEGVSRCCSTCLALQCFCMFCC